MPRKLNWLDVIKDIELIHPNITIPIDQEYICSKTKIKYICKYHGEKTATPEYLKQGYGCKDCVIESKWLDVIKDIETIHSNITVPIDQKYINTDTKIKYNCKYHGEKSARPSDLKQGLGCKDCVIESKWLDVIKDIELIHPNITVPIDQKYINTNIKIRYICEHHGEKSARPSDLKQGLGCKDCVIESKWLDVIKDIELIHPNITVPRDQEYINTKTKIRYICEHHGEQTATPVYLKRGYGCPECGSKKCNWSDVIKDIELIHPNITIPIDQEYINTDTKIRYICKYHGEHTATPASLKSGTGCLKCAYERSREFYTKLVGVTFDDNQSLIRKYCRTGKSLKLERDIHNQYDVNAISVYVEGTSFFIFKYKYKIGHLNKEIAKSLINYFSHDYEIGAYITEITGGGRKKFGVNIQVVAERFWYN